MRLAEEQVRLAKEQAAEEETKKKAEVEAVAKKMADQEAAAWKRATAVAAAAEKKAAEEVCVYVCSYEQVNQNTTSAIKFTL